jgi:voltage-gated potassium channel
VNPAVRDFGGALYLAFLTASTVGYGGTTPMTPAGKIVAGLIVFVAIGLVGLTSARLTAMFIDQRSQEDQIPYRLGLIEREMHEVRLLLDHIASTIGQPQADRDLVATSKGSEK